MATRNRRKQNRVSSRLTKAGTRHPNCEEPAPREKPGSADWKPGTATEFSLPLRKKVLFSAMATLAALSFIEASLAIVGVRPVLYEEDPYVGFTSQIPLFERQVDSNGADVMVTAPNKRRWFNVQSFSAKKPAGTYRIFCMGGSTTYGRPYDDTTSFCGWLRELLPRADASKNWELINAGGVSYASYRVAKLTEELIQYEPDLFIVYSGQNEFLESRTYEDLIQIPSAVRDVGALVSHTRMYAALHRACRGIAGQSERSEKKATTLNAEVLTILGESIGPEDYHRDDVFQQQVLDHYRYNLTRIVDIARSAGAKVVFVTPASNLLDCSPFKSEHRKGLTAAELERWNNFYQRAQDVMSASGWHEAVAFFDDALALDDRYAHLHYLRGRALYRLGKYREATDALIRARDEDVCPLRALGAMADIVTQVAAERRVPIVDFPSHVEARSPHGIPGENLFLDHVHPTIEGNRLLALAVLDEMAQSGQVELAATWNPNLVAKVVTDVEGRLDQSAHAKALRNLSKVLAWAGKFEEARKLSEIAATMIPGDATVHFQMGVCAQGEGDIAKAAGHYRKAIEIQPNYAAAYTNLGHSLELQGKLHEAMDCYRRAIMLNGDDDKALFNLGKALLKQGHAKSAAEHLRRFVGLRPLDAEAYGTLASALVRLGQIPEAREAMKKAVELKSGDPNAHNRLGSLWEAEGEYQKAEQSYRRALELDGRHLGAMENLAWLLATSADAQLRDPAEALRLAETVFSIGGTDDPARLDVLAVAQAASGNYSDATATARRATELAEMRGQSEMARAIHARFVLFAEHKPYVEGTAVRR